MSDRQARGAALGAAFPGLAAFDATPLAIPHEGRVRRLRVGLKGRKYLHLNGLALLPAGVLDDARVEARMSSVLAAKSAAPADFLRGKPIHTGKDVSPFWEASFEEPVLIRQIEIRNRQGRRASRASGLLVEIEDEAGQVTVFDNLSQDGIAGRLGEAREAGATLLEAAGEGRAAGDFGAAWSALLDGTLAAANGEAAAASSLPRLREEAVDRLLLLLRALEGERLKGAIAAAAALSLMLMERAETVRRTPVQPREVRLLAIHVTALVIRRKSRSVENTELRTFRGLYNKEELIPVLEEEMASLYLRATGDAAALPLMVRVHGISGPVLQIRSDDYLGAMEDLGAALGGIGYGSMICYGTLLGAVRDRRFIEHDDDVDMAVVLRTSDVLAEMAGLGESLKEQGLRARVIRKNGLLRVTNLKRRIAIDLFPVIPNADGSFNMFMEGMKVRPVRRDLLLPLGEIDFLGRRFGAPADPAGFLADRYGAGWGTPQRKIGHKTAKAQSA